MSQKPRDSSQHSSFTTCHSLDRKAAPSRPVPSRVLGRQREVTRKREHERSGEGKRKTTMGNRNKSKSGAGGGRRARGDGIVRASGTPRVSPQPPKIRSVRIYHFTLPPVILHCRITHRTCLSHNKACSIFGCNILCRSSQTFRGSGMHDRISRRVCKKKSVVFIV
jgi:hypothetical protein